MLTAVISDTNFLALRLAASCIAISQKGLMYILVLANSTALSLIFILIMEIGYIFS